MNNTPTRISYPLCSDKFNIMIIGDDDVGKTSLLERYSRNNFSSSHIPTRSVDHYCKEYSFYSKVYLFKLWDTVSQKKFLRISKAFFNKADCIIIVCSINNRESFLNISKWVQSINDCIKESSIQIILLSNKCDLEDERQVGLDEIRQKAEDLNIEYFETSASTGYGVNEAFEAIFKKVIQKVYKTENVNNNWDGSNEGEDNMAKKGSRCFGGCNVF